jgi:hypothetical protein
VWSRLARKTIHDDQYWSISAVFSNSSFLRTAIDKHAEAFGVAVLPMRLSHPLHANRSIPARYRWSRKASGQQAVLKLVMHENREEKNDRQRNADKPEQRASSKSHVSLLYDGVLRPLWEEGSSLGTAERKNYSSPPSDLPLRVFKLGIRYYSGAFRF